MSPRQWDRFVRRDWRRQPRHLRGLGALATAAELFDIVVAAAASLEPPTSSGAAGLSMFRLHLGGGSVHDRTLLPRATDGDFAGWRTRVKRDTKRREVALVVYPIQQHSFSLWSRLAQFLAGLFARTGIPAFGVEAGVFVGDYEETPFGVHTDEVDVVMSMVEGDKHMHTWKPDALTLTEATQYGIADISPPRTIEASAGDLAYWPAGFWHVGETRGFSVSLNLALGVVGGTPSIREPRGTTAGLASAAVRELVASSIADQPIALALALPTRRSTALAAPLRRALAPITAAVDNGAFARRLLGEQLARATGYGFIPPPPLAPPMAMSPQDRLRRDPAVPIAHGVIAGWLVVAAAGHAWSLPADPALIRLVRELASGPTRSIAELVAPFRRRMQRAIAPELVLELIASLRCARALTPAISPARRGTERRRQDEQEEASIAKSAPGSTTHPRTARTDLRGRRNGTPLRLGVRRGLTDPRMQG